MQILATTFIFAVTTALGLSAFVDLLSRKNKPEHPLGATVGTTVLLAVPILLFQNKSAGTALAVLLCAPILYLLLRSALRALALARAAPWISVGLLLICVGWIGE